ncbi:MAG: nicotinamide-nucleotide adenylyltransferase [Candidatus Diapherotrites archaeon]
MMAEGKGAGKGVKRGLIVGRFQPYHIGHHNAIKNILQEVDELIIVIGSTADSYTKKNPFTTGERVEMISRALHADSLYEKCIIVPVPDLKEYALWTGRVRAYCPSFNVVYTNNPLVRDLFEDEGMEVKPMVSNQKDVESATMRNAMLNSEKWEHLTPPTVAEFLDKIRAAERLKRIVEEEHKQ